jgi:hypothetical protein
MSGKLKHLRDFLADPDRGNLLSWRKIELRAGLPTYTIKNFVAHMPRYGTAKREVMEQTMITWFGYQAR